MGWKSKDSDTSAPVRFLAGFLRDNPEPKQRNVTSRPATTKPKRRKVDAAAIAEALGPLSIDQPENIHLSDSLGWPRPRPKEIDPYVPIRGGHRRRTPSERYMWKGDSEIEDLMRSDLYSKVNEPEREDRMRGDLLENSTGPR